MKGDRDGLLDELVAKKGTLYRAQSLLLDVYALLDDLEPIDAHADQKVRATQMEVGYFLETVPWEKAPQSTAITFGDAPTLHGSSS